MNDIEMRKLMSGLKSVGLVVSLLLCLLLVTVGSTRAEAQTVFYGGNSSSYSTKVYGDSTYTTTVNASATYTKIYVVFPPQSSGVTNTHFVNYVMTQPSIDGVTLQVPWDVVETAMPMQFDCTASKPPDQCQPDPYAAGWFHTYDGWSFIDGSGCTDHSPNSSSQWFCAFGGVYKSVNFELVGIGGAPTNTVTPSYVTGTTWVSAASPTYHYQDVVNAINASPCTAQNYSGSIPNASSVAFMGDGNGLVNVSGWTSANGVQPANGETIWVSGLAATALEINGQYGAPVYTGTLNGCSSSANFCYAAPATNAREFGTLSTYVVKAVDSWPVPYEKAYAGAWQSFLAAAIYHFNQYSNVNQIAYIRPGVARGGEAIPVCTQNGPLKGGSLAFPGTNPAYSETEWNNWYQTVNAAVQAAQPKMQIMYSLNSGDVQYKNADYATQQAGIAVSYSNATGGYNGFGSQGLQIADDTSFGSCPGGMSAPTTSNNWGCMFTQYWSGGSTPTSVPLELQQVDCSNPDGYYATVSTNQCFINSGGATTTGLTGDLRVIYPFATSNYVSILELYHHDALLAFDPYYCVIASPYCNTTTSDSFGTDLSFDTQLSFFNDVGIDSSCASYYGVPAPAAGSGGCQYANTISTAHGPH